MWIVQAYAQEEASGGTSIFLQLLPLLLIFVVFYFLLIRPQQRKLKQHRSMVAALRRGDEVVTQGGLIGRVVRVVDAKYLQIEFADSVRVRCLRNSVQEILRSDDENDSALESPPDKKRKKAR